MSKKSNKKEVRRLKVVITGAQANPAPPLGPALGQAGLNIPGFCKDFNAMSQDRQGERIPVVIVVYSDKSYKIITKQENMSLLIKKQLNITKASSTPNVDKVGALTDAMIDAIVEKKMPDLRVYDKEAAKKIVLGTARSMGVTYDGGV